MKTAVGFSRAWFSGVQELKSRHDPIPCPLFVRHECQKRDDYLYAFQHSIAYTSAVHSNPKVKRLVLVWHSHRKVWVLNDERVIDGRDVAKIFRDLSWHNRIDV